MGSVNVFPSSYNLPSTSARTPCPWALRRFAVPMRLTLGIPRSGLVQSPLFPSRAVVG